MNYSSLKQILRSWAYLPRTLEYRHGELLGALESQKILSGRQLAETYASCSPNCLSEVEFQVFSQWGDDGIIQWLLRHIDFAEKSFVEFGVENYQESNTRFLLQNNHWKGLAMDCSPANIESIARSSLMWRHDITPACAMVTAENINQILAEQGFTGDIGILHIDIDGNDYWVWNALTIAKPVLVIVEYNAVFGPDRSITIPYRPDFNRLRAHHSGLYAGASISAFRSLATQKGYCYLGCNGAGNNAYFVLETHMTPKLRNLNQRAGYVESRFRESRDASGKLDYCGGSERIKLITGLPVIQVPSGETEFI